MDFVPCVQRCATPCQPVPNPFGGSFGGKLVRRILANTAQINAQLWFHWEMRIPISQGSRKWKAQRIRNEILLSSKKLYAALHHCTPVHRPCHREKRPCLGTFTQHRRGTRFSQILPQNPLFPGIFILPQRHLPRRDFPVQVNPTQINN